MPSTFSPSLRIELIGEGEQSGLWGNTTNNNLGDLIEQAIAGRTTLNVTAGDITLSSLNGVVDEARSAVLAVTGTPGVTRVLTIPNVEKSYTVINETINIVQVKTSSGTAFNCPPSATTVIACDGTNGVQGSGIAPLTSPAFTGVPTAPTAAIGTSTTQLATTEFVANSLPVGLITLWYGSIASIPSGWALCNGSSGTPDLRDRFVVGAGTTYTPGNTGGANTVTLDTTQIPSHTHNGSGTTSSTNVDHTHSGTTANTSINHAHSGSGTTSTVSNDHSHGFSGTTSTIGDHVHAEMGAPGQSTPDGSLNCAIGYGGGPAPVGYNTAGGGSHSHTYSGSTGGISANHTHTYSFTTSASDPVHAHTFTTGAMSANAAHTHTFSFTSTSTGGGLAHENRPPYMALCYIMKI